MSTAFQLRNRVVVVTGATGGIGGALARALAAEGARLILCGRNQVALKSLAASLPEKSLQALVEGSLTHPACRRNLAQVAANSGASVLVNAMGINQPGLFARQRCVDLERLIATNLAAPMAVTQALLPALQRHDCALVVNIGSVFGSIGHPGYAGYCATKFGLRGFSEALRRELADTPVRVLHVEPRATRTAMNDGPTNQLNTALGNTEDSPERVASVVVDAMRNLRPRTTIGWPERFFASINRSIPALVDRALQAKLNVIKSSLTRQSS